MGRARISGVCKKEGKEKIKHKKWERKRRKGKGEREGGIEKIDERVK